MAALAVFIDITFGYSSGNMVALYAPKYSLAFQEYDIRSFHHSKRPHERPNEFNGELFN